MTTFNVTVEVGQTMEGPFERLQALVDTGAFYTWVPASVLRNVAISPHGERQFVLANGEEITRDVGRAWIRIDGRMEVTIVVFGDEGSEPLLGAVTLEEFALAADPVNQRLMPVPRLPMLRADIIAMRGLGLPRQ